jgi:crotonobetainyl-CoA:carnitine CoA-transferase CaiB-like acyl-CoA transferase
MADEPGSEGALLAGVRVVDLTDAYGAATSRVLADLGAEVVRVESPDGGAARRRVPLSAAGTSLHHLYRNTGKSTLVRDAALAPDRDAVDSLLHNADIVVISDGWANELPSWSADELTARHRHLVVVSITPFGLRGPAAGWASTELVSQAMAGVVYRSGVPELPPVAAPGSYCEDVGAVTAAMAALLALFQRGDGVSGQLVDVSAVMALAQCTDTALPLWSLLRSDQTRLGAGLYPLFPCTDGLARMVLPMTAGDWRSLLAWLGSPPEWVGPAWEKALLGPDERAEVLKRLPARFATRTRAEVTADGDASGLRVTPVLTPAELLTNEHVIARETFAPVDVDGASGSVMAGYLSVGGRRASAAGASPELDPATWAASPRRVAPTPRVAPPGRVAPRNVPAEGLPLTGLRVLELGSGVASPEAGRVLAEWGADVIKIESRQRPDFQRVVMGSDMNPAFASPNRSKRLLGANLATEPGRALVYALLPHIDVVLENNATGVLDRLGFGWDVLRAANRRIVLVSSQLYGDRGPWAARKGYGPSARAVGSLTWLWAHDPDAPRGVMTIHPDHFAGRLGALGALAALHARDRTGAGSRVDIAQFEAVAGLLGDLLLTESLEPGAAQPVGNTSSEHAPWGLYRCRDDGPIETWIALCVTSDEAWGALRTVAGDALPDQPHWRTTEGRLAARADIDARLGAWLRDADPAAIEAACQHAGIAAAQALHPRIQVDHPHLRARGIAMPVDQPGSGHLLFEGPAFTGTVSGSPRCGPAPLPGQHSREICRELLGLDDAAVDALVAQGALDVE